MSGLTSATPIRLYAAFLNSTFSSTGRPAVTFTDDEELAKLPMYYVMDPDKTMPETMAPYMLSPVEVALHLDDSAARHLSPTGEMHALQIVRESISNAMRHGRPRSVAARTGRGPRVFAHAAVARNHAGDVQLECVCLR